MAIGLFVRLIVRPVYAAYGTSQLADSAFYRTTLPWNHTQVYLLLCGCLSFSSARGKSIGIQGGYLPLYSFTVYGYHGEFPSALLPGVPSTPAPDSGRSSGLNAEKKKVDCGQCGHIGHLFLLHSNCGMTCRFWHCAEILLGPDSLMAGRSGRQTPVGDSCLMVLCLGLQPVMTLVLQVLQPGLRTDLL